MTLKNRVVVAPMHQYAAEKGFATDWHLMNAGRYAAGGAGLVIMESTKVERRGCGTVGDLGLWDDAFIPGLKRCVDFIRQHGAVPGIQLGHSGRKARRFRPWEGGAPLEPSRPRSTTGRAGSWSPRAPINAPATDPTPRALTRDEIPEVIERWGQAARRAHEAGFEVLDIHGAHGYLIHQFLSPFSNVRNDEYGGSELNRMRFCIEVVESVRAHWPASKPLFLRLSVEDDSGWGPDQSVALAKIVKPKGVDVIDCSSGGMRGSPVVSAGPVTYGYQVPYAERLRSDAGIMSMAVGLIVHADQAEQILQEGTRRPDRAGARAALQSRTGRWTRRRSSASTREFGSVPPPQAYWLAKRAQSVKTVVPSTYMKGMNAP